MKRKNRMKKSRNVYKCFDLYKMQFKPDQIITRLHKMHFPTRSVQQVEQRHVCAGHHGRATAAASPACRRTRRQERARGLHLRELLERDEREVHRAVARPVGRASRLNQGGCRTRPRRRGRPLVDARRRGAVRAGRRRGRVRGVRAHLRDARRGRGRARVRGRVCRGRVLRAGEHAHSRCVPVRRGRAVRAVTLWRAEQTICEFAIARSLFCKKT